MNEFAFNQIIAEYASRLHRRQKHLRRKFLETTGTLPTNQNFDVSGIKKYGLPLNFLKLYPFFYSDHANLKKT